SVDWRTYTTARRRRCASVTFARSFIALRLHQPRQEPCEHDRHFHWRTGGKASHTAAATSVSPITSASCPDITTSVLAGGCAASRTTRPQRRELLTQTTPPLRRCHDAERRRHA